MAKEYEIPKCRDCQKEVRLLRIKTRNGETRWQAVEQEQIWLYESTGEQDENGKWLYQSKMYYKQHTCPEGEKKRAEARAKREQEGGGEGEDKPPF